MAKKKKTGTLLHVLLLYSLKKGILVRGDTRGYSYNSCVQLATPGNLLRVTAPFGKRSVLKRRLMS